MTRRYAPKRDLSDVHHKVIAYLAERAKGSADGKTVNESTISIASRLRLSPVDVSKSVRQLERWRCIEIIRPSTGTHGDYLGFRVLRLLPGMEVEQYADQPAEVSSNAMPPTPKLDAAIDVIDLVESEITGMGAVVRFLPVVEEAIMLRRWAKKRYGS